MTLDAGDANATEYAQYYTWTPPIYDLSLPPESRQIYALQSSEPDGGLDTSRQENENFARNVRWTPDGTMFMAHCENRSLQLFSASTPYSTQPIKPTLTLHQPAPILDFTWFPSASPQNPASFCFLTSVRECPVKLVDGSDGRLRASYKIIDHRERFIAPHCMTFNLDGTKIYCGYEDSIHLFDVSRPGEGTRIGTTPSKKSKDGLKGIVSALAFANTQTGTGTGTESQSSDGGFFAAGTLNPSLANLALYNESQCDTPLMFVGGGERAGIMQLKFNPTSPHILYASYRRRESIYAWDLRSDVSVPFAKYTVPPPRSAQTQAGTGANEGTSNESARMSERTNQKMIFDVDVYGSKLSVGTQDGRVCVFDLTSPHPTATTTSPELEEEEWNREPEMVYPTLVFDAHSDSVGGVAFHSYKPVLLTCSGSRHFDYNDDESLESNSSSSSESEPDSDEEVVEVGKEEQKGKQVHVQSRSLRMKTRGPVARDSSIKVWEFGVVQQSASEAA